MYSITPLIVASSKGFTEKIRLLSRVSNLDVIAMDEIGMKQTALHWAVESGHMGAVRSLLEIPSIDVNLTGSEAKSPLIISIEKDNAEIAILLLDHDADPNLGFKFLVGYTRPLNLANNDEMKNLLKQYGGIQGYWFYDGYL